MKRSLTRRIKGLYQPAVVQVAKLHRRRLGNTHVIGITGSCGKTSAKDFTAAVLAGTLAGRKSYDTTNGIYSVARTLLATRRSHSFCVQEVGAFEPGNIDPPLRLLQPTIGVITVIGSDHYSSFRGPEGVVSEKRKLIDILPGNGIAVLNIDDPYLADVAKNANVDVIGFGRSQNADVRATNVAAVYPERLSFCVSVDGQTMPVRTGLFGEHQLTSVLAAIAVGKAVGLPITDIVRAIESCASPRGRMEYIETPGGINFINDSYKSPYWSLDAAFEFMRSARARRKWIVVGHIADHKIKSRTLYRRVTEAALSACDRAVFIGSSAHHAPGSGGRVHSFAEVREANVFLHSELERGDLVLLKGNNLTQHLGRLFLSQTRSVSCWREDCRRAIDCRSCNRLHARSWPLRRT